MSTKLSWAFVSAENAGGRRRMVVYASKLAGLAGMHVYVNRDELFYELMHALTPESEEVPEGYEPPAEKVQKALDEGLTHTARQIYEETLKDLPKLAAGESVKVVKHALAAIKAIPGVSADAKEAVRATLYAAHGINGETQIREDAAKSLGEIKVNERFTTSELLFKAGIFDVYLGGKHDGMADGGKVITEIKNRVNRFMGVPLYERVQIHAYMKIYGVEKGLLIESFKGQRREHIVDFDQNMWDGIVTSACNFLSSFGTEDPLLKIQPDDGNPGEDLCLD
jgi:hypothetical protein